MRELMKKFNIVHCKENNYFLLLLKVYKNKKLIFYIFKNCHEIIIKFKFKTVEERSDYIPIESIETFSIGEK